jgi:hypothetical protein
MHPSGADLASPVEGSVSVYLGLLNIARIPLSLVFESTAKGAAQQVSRPQATRPFRKIFASYSRKDEAVVQVVHRFAGATGDRYLRDLTDLRAGEEWQEGIGDLIEEADVFQLFWSSHSMRSPIVQKEWQYALELGRSHFVRPTYWENPLPCSEDDGLPSDALRELHFHDIGPL